MACTGKRNHVHVDGKMHPNVRARGIDIQCILYLQIIMNLILMLEIFCNVS